MNRNQLRYFLAVADEGSFSRAATRLHITQPALSVGVAKLEETLGARLLERTTRSVTLTAAGARFLEHAKRIEAAYDTAIKDVVAPAKAARVRVAVLNTIASADSVRIVREAAAAREAVELIDGAERDIAKRLLEGRIDAAITIMRPNLRRLAHTRLWRERYVMALPEGHPLASEKAFDGALLARETMIVRRHCEALPAYNRYFTARGVRPAFSIRTTNDDKALLMVRAGFGVTVVPSSFRAAGVSLARLRGFDESRDICVFTPQQTQRLESVVRLIRTCFETLGQR